MQINSAPIDLTPITLKYNNLVVGAIPTVLSDFIGQDKHLGTLLSSQYYSEYILKFVESDLLPVADVSAILNQIQGTEYECDDSEFALFYRGNKHLISAIDHLAAHTVVTNKCVDMSYFLDDVSERIEGYQADFSLSCSIEPVNEYASSDMNGFNELVPVFTLDNSIFVFQSFLEQYPTELAHIAQKLIYMLCHHGGVGLVQHMNPVASELVDIWCDNYDAYLLACALSHELTDEDYISTLKTIFSDVYEEMLEVCNDHCLIEPNDIEEERRLLQDMIVSAKTRMHPLYDVISYDLADFAVFTSELQALPKQIRCQYQEHCDVMTTIFDMMLANYELGASQALTYNSDFGNCEYYLLASTMSVGDLYNDINERYQHQQQTCEHIEIVVDDSSTDKLTNLFNHYMCWVLLDALTNQFEEL